MKKNQLTITKSSAIILGKSKSLMGITKKLLERKNKDLTKVKSSQDLATHEGITIIGDLMWGKVSTEPMTWHDAIVYVGNLRQCGYNDWRLPTIDELGEVVRACGGEFHCGDDDKSNNNADDESYQACYEAKGFVSREYFWSSTSDITWEPNAWRVRFYFGDMSSCSKDAIYLYGLDIKDYSYVRCVRP